MNEWALITGASSGIGRELTLLFAHDKFNLVIVARNEERLRALASELQRRHGINTVVLPTDLAKPGAARETFEAVKSIQVSILVNNAGFGNFGAFHESDLRAESEMMQVNMVALSELTHLFLQPMLARQQGRILNVASTAAFQPGPLMNVYYASKAFVYSFSYALAVELEGTGITVTTLCPGTTRTEFFERARMRMRKGWPMMDARRAAECGYRGLLQGKRVVIPGVLNNIASAIAKRMPSRITSAFVRRLNQQVKN